MFDHPVKVNLSSPSYNFIRLAMGPNCPDAIREAIADDAVYNEREVALTDDEAFAAFAAAAYRLASGADSPSGQYAALCIASANPHARGKTPPCCGELIHVRVSKAAGRQLLTVLPSIDAAARHFAVCGGDDDDDDDDEAGYGMAASIYVGGDGRNGWTMTLTPTELACLLRKLAILDNKACALLRSRIVHYLANGEWPTDEAEAA